MTRATKQLEEALAAVSQRVREQICAAITQMEFEVSPAIANRLDDIEDRLDDIDRLTVALIQAIKNKQTKDSDITAYGLDSISPTDFGLTRAIGRLISRRREMVE